MPQILRRRRSPLGLRQFSVNFALALTLFPFVCRAETAILDCTAAAALPVSKAASKNITNPVPDFDLSQGILLDFPFSIVKDWRVTKATLFLHLPQGLLPPRLEVAVVSTDWNAQSTSGLDVRKLQFLAQPSEPKPESWFAVGFPAALVELLAAGKGHGFAIRLRSSHSPVTVHGRKAGVLAPRLQVEGSALSSVH
jgi:hypothetical protein